MDKTSHEWYRIENLSAGGADVFIYDEIGSEGKSATDFVKELAKVSGPINLRLNSPGGEVYDGIAIYHALKNRGHVTVYVDALAASISSVIAMAGDKVVMEKHSTMMIHDAMGGVMGNAAEVQKLVDRLEDTSEEIASVYAERAGGDVADWRALMKEETWYTAQQAVDAGLADEVAAPPKSRVKAQLEPRIFNLTHYKHVPVEVVAQQTVVNVGRVLSKVNLEQLHTGMSAMQKVHDAACDTENCSAGAKARSDLTIKAHYEMKTHTAAACMVACLHETLTDLAQDWLEDGYVTMPEFLAVSALITEVVTTLSSGLDSAGVADREIPDWDDEVEPMVHTISETYAKDVADPPVAQANVVVEVPTVVEEVVVDESKDDTEDEEPLVAIDFTTLFAKAIEAAQEEE